MTTNMQADREFFKAVSYPPHEFLTVIHGPSGPVTAMLTADELLQLNWPVTVDASWNAYVVVPSASGVAS